MNGVCELDPTGVLPAPAPEVFMAITGEAEIKGQRAILVDWVLSSRGLLHWTVGDGEEGFTLQNDLKTPFPGQAIAGGTHYRAIL